MGKSTQQESTLQGGTWWKSFIWSLITLQLSHGHGMWTIQTTKISWVLKVALLDNSPRAKMSRTWLKPKKGTVIFREAKEDRRQQVKEAKLVSCARQQTNTPNKEIHHCKYGLQDVGHCINGSITQHHKGINVHYFAHTTCDLHATDNAEWTEYFLLYIYIYRP